MCPAQRTSTQLVFPPMPTVPGPGVGMLPLTPQNLTRSIRPHSFGEVEAYEDRRAGVNPKRRAWTFSAR
ncbi:MAG: hypothetical protein OHK0013_29950 [Sandaracinaceae bacterium]